MIDQHGETWRDIVAWAERETTASRAILDSVATGPEQTNYHRGRLAALRELIALATPKPAPHQFAPTPYA